MFFFSDFGAAVAKIFNKYEEMFFSHFGLQLQRYSTNTRDIAHEKHRKHKSINNEANFFINSLIR